MKIIAYKRTESSPWVDCPRATGAALQRFALLGSWTWLQLELPDGTTWIVSELPREESA